MAGNYSCSLPHEVLDVWARAACLGSGSLQAILGDQGASTFCCAVGCYPVCRACRDNPNLWEPLIFVELYVPRCIVRQVKQQQQQQQFMPPQPPPQPHQLLSVTKGQDDNDDMLESLAVPDPRSLGDALLTVRAVHRGGYIHLLAYEECPGLMVRSHCLGGAPEGRKLLPSGGKTHVTSPMSGASRFTRLLARASRTPTAAASPTAVLCTANMARYETATFTIEVYERRQPSALPAAVQADRQSGSSSLCDVTLSADGRDFPAHRVVLAAGSDVFKAMFTGDFKEKSADRVEIKETSAKALGKFLDFLYEDCCPDWDECEMELLALADQYQVQRLTKLCLSRLWMLPSAEALAVLARSSRSPLLAPYLMDRLCRQAALLLFSLRSSDDWRALRESDPFAAGLVTGMAKARGPAWSLSHLEPWKERRRRRLLHLHDY